MRSYLLSLLFLLGLSSFAQQDTGRVMNFDTFMAYVKAEHPIAKQAGLQMQQGEAKEQAARGSFDPKIGADVQQKYYDGTQYYDLSGAGLKVPTWFGIELESGYEQNRGDFLNPENTVPNAGLWTAGVSVPLGQGLFIDQRRASLRQAQIYRESTDAVRQAMLNGLIYDAGKAYWNWYMAYNQVIIYQEAVDLALQRFNAVQMSTSLGDAPYIDTLESGIQVQSRKLNLQEAELDFANETAKLSVFLWSDGLIPLELEENTHPMLGVVTEDLPLELTDNFTLDTLLDNHPELRKIEFQLEQLDIERRWKSEQLKPDLRLKYNPIAAPINQDPLSQYSINNYTWGLQFEFPIFLRKERGNLNFVKLQYQEMEMNIALKRQNLKNKVQIAINEWQTTIQQVELFSRTTRDYLGLLQGEQQLFDGGESSLFMVNSRELGYINARIKLVELLAKNHKAKLKAYYALGLLSQ